MYDRELIDEQEYLRLVYRFSGETMQGKPPSKGIRKDLMNKPANAAAGSVKTDSETGEVKVKVPGA
jgi:hypothetical protein